MTTLERIVELYPLHAQVILEHMYECEVFNHSAVGRQLKALFDGGPVLVCAFLWSNTPEGHGYWKALARAEGYGDATH